MPARFTVYCKRSAALVTPTELLKGVEYADLHTIAESCDIDDKVIIRALDQLRIKDLKPGKFCFYRICYRPDGYRQVDVERWQTANEVISVSSEVINDLVARGHPALERIRDHLDETVDIIDASFGSFEYEQMALVIAS